MGRQPNGVLQWDVARPCPEGWMALGSVHKSADGYRARGPFELRPLATVTDAAEALAAIAADWDAEHDAPTMFTVPAEDVGPGGRVYASAGEGQ